MGDSLDNQKLSSKDAHKIFITAAYYIYQRYFNELRFLKMDEMRTTNQVEDVNKHLKEIPKEADERRIENQPQTGKNEKAIEPF